MAEKIGQIPVARPTLGEAEAAAARRAILSGWVVQGPEVEAFEKEFAALVGAPHAVACSSGTAALHLALLALNLQPGDEVITVSSSFIATANAVRYVGATPVFVDVELETGNMNPDLIEGAVTERTRAILTVHQLGMPCNLERILAIAGRHNLPVIEDAACAIGSEIRLTGGAWEAIGQPARGAGHLFLSSPQGPHHRRRRYGYRERPRGHGPTGPAQDPRHVPVHRRAPRRRQGDVRAVPGGGIQLPPQRHPGRRGPGAAQAPAGPGVRPAAAGGPLPGEIVRAPPSYAAPGAGLCPEQLAVLLDHSQGRRPFVPGGADAGPAEPGPSTPGGG